MRGVGFLMLIVAAAWGQAPPRMVRLNVVAEGANGGPATELAAGDLQISDAGKPQTIALFRKNDTANTRAAAGPLAPGEFSNRGAGTPAQVTVVLFDVLNTTMKDQAYVRGRIIDALQPMKDGDSVYFYLLTLKGLAPVRALPEVGEPAAGPDAGWTQQMQTKLDAAMKGVNRLGPHSDNMEPQDRVNATYQWLAALLSRLGSVSGRKNLVWVTRGIPIEIGARHAGSGSPAEYEEVLRRLSTAFDASGVAVYPVEAFGPRREEGEEFLEEQQTLEEIAGMTGGQLYAQADVPAAMKAAMEASRSSYVVGYYPPAENWDGKVHKIKLKCAKEGVKLESKTEYVAYKEAEMGAAEEQEAFRAAIRSPFDASEIGLWALRGASKTDPKKTRLQLRIDAHDLTMQPVGTAYHCDLSVAYVSYGKNGEPWPTRPVAMPIDFVAAQRDEILKDGINVGGDIAFREGVDKVRIIVLDNYSGAVGSVTLTGIGKAGS
jgi:VWFA-related protein